MPESKRSKVEVSVSEELEETLKPRQAAGGNAPMVLNTRPLFKLMVERKASDLFFTSNSPIKVKIEGSILPINKQVLTPETVRQAAYGWAHIASDRPTRTSNRVTGEITVEAT